MLRLPSPGSLVRVTRWSRARFLTTKVTLPLDTSCFLPHRALIKRPQVIERLEYQHIAARFPARGERFDADLVRLRAKVYATARFSTAAFVQYSSAVHAATLNLRVSYTFQEGNDLWVVVNQAVNTDRDRVSPSLPAVQSASLLVKYSYTFGN
jgi:hypothetical protein